MQLSALITTTILGLVLFFLVIFPAFEPQTRRVTSLQSQEPISPLAPTATQAPIPTTIPYDTPSPQAMEEMAGLTPVPHMGPETAGTTLVVGPPRERVTIILPMNFHLAGFIISSICAYPGDLMQYCPDGVWAITDGEYFIYVQPHTGHIFPEADAWASDPYYFDRFQWLIKPLGADKIVDVLWLEDQIGTDRAEQAPFSSPMLSSDDVGATGTANQIFLPMVAVNSTVPTKYDILAAAQWGIESPEIVDARLLFSEEATQAAGIGIQYADSGLHKPDDPVWVVAVKSSDTSVQLPDIGQGDTRYAGILWIIKAANGDGIAMSSIQNINSDARLKRLKALPNREGTIEIQPQPIPTLVPFGPTPTAFTETILIGKE